MVKKRSFLFRSWRSYSFSIRPLFNALAYWVFLHAAIHMPYSSSVRNRLIALHWLKDVNMEKVLAKCCNPLARRCSLKNPSDILFKCIKYSIGMWAVVGTLSRKTHILQAVHLSSTNIYGAVMFQTTLRHKVNCSEM